MKILLSILLLMSPLGARAAFPTMQDLTNVVTQVVQGTITGIASNVVVAAVSNAIASISLTNINNGGVITYSNTGFGTSVRFVASDNSIRFYGTDPVSPAWTASADTIHIGGATTISVDAPFIFGGRATLDTNGNVGLGYPGVINGSNNLYLGGGIVASNTVAGRSLSSTGFLITNNGVAWCATNLALGTLPTITLPNGSYLTTTGGVFYYRTNSIWVQK